MKKIFIAIPSYGYKCYTPCVDSLLKLQKLVDSQDDVDIEFKFIYQESLITRARNTLVYHFLSSECTHLMFIDADIAFHAEDVLQMLNHDKDLIVGAYPHKNLIKKEGLSDQACFQYAVDLKKQTEHGIVDGLVEIDYGATGFMMMKRSVITTMIDKYPETKYISDMDVAGEFQKEFHALFDCVIDPEKQRYLSEDYTFCKRWREIGGTLYLDINVNLTHIGTKMYDGSYLMKLAETGALQRDA